MKMAYWMVAVAAMTVGISAHAAERGTADEAKAMTNRAVAEIKAAGPDKAYAEINAKDPRFHDRDLYAIVYDDQGKCLAHGANAKLVGKDLLGMQDVDGKFYVKERVEKAKAGAPFWQDYKFTDPETRKIEPKSTYCEPVNNTAVCVGIYKP